MIETITQDLSALGTSGANKVLARRKVLSLSTAQLDKRLKNGEVQRRFQRFMEKGLPTGSARTVVTDAIIEALAAKGADGRSAADKTGVSDEDRAAMIADEE